MSQTDSTQASAKKVKSTLLSPLYQSGFVKPYKFFIYSSEDLDEVSIELNPSISLKDGILKSIIQSQLPLDPNPKNYEVYMAKKNGKPQRDFPPFQLDIILDSTGINAFTIVHTFETKPARKGTGSPERYINSLPSQPQMKELPKKKQNWFLKLIGCGN